MIRFLRCLFGKEFKITHCQREGIVNIKEKKGLYDTSIPLSMKILLSFEGKTEMYVRGFVEKDGNLSIIKYTPKKTW